MYNEGEATKTDLKRRSSVDDILVATKRTIRVSLERAISSQHFNARLLDLSSTATKLSLQMPCPVDEDVRIRLRINELSVDQTLAAQACWLRYDDGDDWHADFAFEQPVDEELLATLLDAGYLERRRDVRLKTSLPVVIRTLSGAEREERCTLTDYSVGGACLRTPDALKKGDQLIVDVDPGSSKRTLIFVQVRWIKPSALGFVTGCRFLSSDGFEQLREVAHAVESTSLWHQMLKVVGVSKSLAKRALSN